VTNPGILFFVPELLALDNPVMHAQVLSLAAFLNRSGFNCRLIGTETSKQHADKAQSLVRKSYKLEAIDIPTE
jgi:hypothetical protein